MNQILSAIKMTLVWTVFCGGVFPVLIWGLSQVFMSTQANGSLLKDSKGNLIGSSLIGQQFVAPKYFHPRPSAAGNGYDAANSSGTNLGPTSAKLFEGVQNLTEAYRKENNLALDIKIPVDAVTHSASGLDPDISPANAWLQAARVAHERKLTVEQVEKLINENIETRFLGIFGEPRINVLKLNLILDKL